MTKPAKQRPPKGSTPEQLNVAVPEGTQERLKAYAKAKGHPTASEALRRLLVEAFDKAGV